MTAASNQEFCIEVLSGLANNPVQVEDAARCLLEELACVPGLRARLAEGGTPLAGAKSVSSSLPEIIVAASAAGALLPTIIATIRDWILRQPPATTIRIKDGEFELEWTGSSPPKAIEDGVSGLLARRVS